MQQPTYSDKNNIHIEDLYPELNSEQQAEAAYFLARYVELVQRVFERVSNLTESDQADTMRMQ